MQYRLRTACAATGTGGRDGGTGAVVPSYRMQDNKDLAGLLFKAVVGTKT